MVSYQTPMPSCLVSDSFCFHWDLKAENRITDAHRLHASISPVAGGFRGCLTEHSGHVIRPQRPQDFFVAKNPKIFLEKAYIDQRNIQTKQSKGEKTCLHCLQNFAAAISAGGTSTIWESDLAFFEPNHPAPEPLAPFFAPDSAENEICRTSTGGKANDSISRV